MAGKSQYFSDKVLGVLKGVALSGVTPYVSLHQSGVPASDDSSPTTELIGNGYARQVVTFGAVSTDADGHTRKIANTSTPTFGPATADWSQAVYFGIYDAVSGGNYLYGGTLTVPKTVQNGDSAQYAVGALVVEED